MNRYDDDDDKIEHRVDEILDKVKQKGRRGIAKVVYGRSIMIVLLILFQLFYFYFLLLRYQKYTIYFYTGVSLISIAVVLLIVNEQINPMYKIAWIIPVVALPVFGTGLYFFIRFQPGPKIMRKKMDTVAGNLKKYVSSDTDVEKSLKEKSKDAYNTSRYLNSTVNFPVYHDSTTEYFSCGEKMFKRLLIELEKAKDFIFIEYFIIEHGIMWDAILEILKAKAKEGVEIRVMYDGTCNFKLLPYSYPKKLKEFGINARIFSPLKPVLSIHQNNRDHRKIVVIDGKTAFTGGINLADEYINEVVKFGYWKDTAVMIKGSAVNSFTNMFLQMWSVSEKNPDIELSRYFPCEKLENQKGYVIPYADTPLDHVNTGEQVYLDIINQAVDYVYIMTPYLILDNEMMNALKSSAKRGVDVRIIMPHIPDKKFVFALGRSFYTELLNAGVKIYEFIPGFVHAKVFLSDNAKAVVGTINLDYRSLFLHFECACYMYDTECIETIHADFEETFDKCMPVTNDYYKKTSLLMRFIGRFLRLIAPMM